MKCPFCAEEIQDAALLCRYCAAEKRDGEWVPPPRASQDLEVPPVAGRFTLRSAGALLLVSTLLELFSLTSPVVLFGGLRSGVVAVGYHLLFAAVFTWMGLGLWLARSWGYRAVLFGSAMCVVDKLFYLIDSQGRAAELESQTQAFGQLAQLVDSQLIARIVVATSLTAVFSWIGFAIYVRIRRDYFQPRS